MATLGNTVKLTAEFKTFDDVYADPTDITLIIYDDMKNQVGETIDITATHKDSTGIYSYLYEIPLGHTTMVYEYSGTLNETTILGRSTMDCNWT